jgi:hypothetical protein
MLPSPTADATRLTGPKRTSPHAKTPADAGLEEVRVAVELPAARGLHARPRQLGARHLNGGIQDGSSSLARFRLMFVGALPSAFIT